MKCRPASRAEQLPAHAELLHARTQRIGVKTERCRASCAVDLGASASERSLDVLAECKGQLDSAPLSVAVSTGSLEIRI
jgi:hypothetical protein